MLRGQAEILAAGSEHDDAQALLRSRYPQLAAMQIAHLPVIAVRIARVTSWGDLSEADVIPGRLVPRITRQPRVRQQERSCCDPGNDTSPG